MRVRKLIVAAAAVAGLSIGMSIAAFAGTPRTMSEYAGMGTNIEIDSKIFDLEEQARQTVIRDCMAELELPYEVLPSDFNVFSPSDDKPAYYGLVESFAESQRDRIEVLPDPNLEYAESLSTDGRQTYYDALFGEDWEREDQVSVHFEASCTGKAYAAVPGVADEAATLRHQYWESLRSAVDTSPRVVAALSQWSKCLSSHGFSADSPSALQETIDSAIVESLGADGVLDREDFDRLQLLEAEAYRADLGCRGDLAAAIEKAVSEFDAAFIHDHGEQLERFLPSARGLTTG